MITVTELLPDHPAVFTNGTTWADLCVIAGDLPAWVMRIALSETASRGILIVAEESAGSMCVSGGCTALLATLDRAGFFLDRLPGDPSGVYVLRPQVRRAMLIELERHDPGFDHSRQELLRAGVRLGTAGMAAQLANWASEARDWQSLEAIWITYAPGELLANPRVRRAYLDAPADERANWPGLSFGWALSAALDPASGDLDLDCLVTALIADGRMLHAGWREQQSADAKVAAGTLWMLAQSSLPESLNDPTLEQAHTTYLELSKVIRESSLAAHAVRARSLTFFHSTAALVMFLRADWLCARREAELGMILTDHCGFPGFLAAMVLANSSCASGNSQYAFIADEFLARHAAHNCPVARWIEPGMHLARADAATRSLDKEGTLHEVKLHELEGSANRWFNTDTMSARVLSTASILWSDPERGLALIDSIADDAGFEASHETPWGPLLIRARAELLVKLGALSRAEPLVVDLLANRDVSASAVPAVRFSLCSGDFDQAVAKADEVIFSPELSLADRAHLYALKAAALQLAGASADQVARAATAACVVCEQASTLVPFAMLPAAVRSILLAQHDQHHAGECYITRARERRAFEGLWDFGAQAPVAVRLTRREEVLLPLLATSATIREIANQQFVSVNTVRKQVVSLRKKLGTSSRGELVRRAHELGLLPAYARMSA